MSLFKIALLTWVSFHAAAQEPAVGSVEGIIVDSVTGEPVAGTEVDLILDGMYTTAFATDGKARSFRVTTKLDGRFVFSDVPPREYRLVAVHPGSYVPAEYGQRAPDAPGRPLTVVPGQDRDNIRLMLIPTGAITGRVLRTDGQPVVSGLVHALKTAYRDGNRTKTIVQSVKTDDSGRYRLFWLMPGEYFVSALAKPGRVDVPRPGMIGTIGQYTSPSVFRRVLDTGEVIDETAVMTYYPGSTAPEDATVVRIDAGTTVSDIDITAELARSYRIQGTVVDSDGNPQRATLQTFPTKWAPYRMVSWATVPPGATAGGQPRDEFTLRGLVPGLYVLKVLSMSIPVQIVDQDLRDFTIVTQPSELHGTIRNSDGYLQVRAATSGIALHPELGGPPLTGNVSESGAFTVPGVIPGNYRVSLNQYTFPYFESIRFGTDDGLTDGLQIEDPSDATLEIVVGRGSNTVSGQAIDDTGQPFHGAVVALVPNVRERLDLYRNTSTESGRFSISRVAPGDYTLYAWESVPDGAWMNVDFLVPYEAFGVPISIDSSSELEVNLSIVPPVE